MLLALLLIQAVLGELAPLFTQEVTVNKGDLRSYLIIFNEKAPDMSQEAIQKWLSVEYSVNPEEVGNSWNIANLFRGFSAYLSRDEVLAIRNHSSIEFVEEDSVVSIDAAFTARQDWGQIRANQGARNLSTNSATNNYNNVNSYPSGSAATETWDFLSGVQQNISASTNNDGSKSIVCIVDTGIRATHQEFVGRVARTANFVPNEANTDLNGHGTHVAGTTAGSYRGLAPRATIFVAKVLNQQGSGTNTQVVDGINWCANQFSSGDKTQTFVLNLSLGGAVNTATNNAINAAAAAGCVPVVAAGNENTNACTRSPASARDAITVAATASDDGKASFSNYAECVNIWAPGVSIHSAWITNDQSYNTISGTSMASPVVAGVVAGYGNAGYLTQAVAQRELDNRGTRGVVKNCPPATPNILVSTGRKP